MHKHKVHLFARGNFFQFYLDIPLEEAQRRYDVRLATIPELERAQELKNDLAITEIDFDDYFFIWLAGSDINEYAKMCITNLDKDGS